MSTDSLAHKKFNAAQRRQRTRANMHGSIKRPRLSVFISNKHMSAQVINDDEGRTLAYATTVGRKADDNMTDAAAWLGGEIAKSAKAAKVKKVVFDRGDNKYHGRMKQLAEAARSAGLEF